MSPGSCSNSSFVQMPSVSLSAPTAGIACCECGTAIIEPVATWWGGQPCHRDCGEAAWRRAVAEGRYLGHTGERQAKR